MNPNQIISNQKVSFYHPDCFDLLNKILKFYVKTVDFEISVENFEILFYWEEQKYYLYDKV